MSLGGLYSAGEAEAPAEIQIELTVPSNTLVRSITRVSVDIPVVGIQVNFKTFEIAGRISRLGISDHLDNCVNVWKLGLDNIAPVALLQCSSAWECRS